MLTQQCRSTVRTLGTAYALKAGGLVHVSQVVRGLACGCLCPGCEQPMLARKGSQRAHHFAHAFPSHCDGGVETILHRLGKEIFKTLNSCRMPEYWIHLRTDPKKSGVALARRALVVPAHIMHIETCYVEPHLFGIVPDVVLHNDRRDLFVEIVVSHPVSRAKQRILRRHSQATIAVCLTSADALLSREELTSKLAQDQRCKQWIFHPRQRGAEAEFFSALRRERHRVRRQQRTDRQITREQLLVTGRQKPFNKSPVAHITADWRTWDEFARAFERRHGRWPSLEESRAFAETLKKR